MSIIGTTDFGDCMLLVTVDHDPTTTATDVPIGSLICQDGTSIVYLKLDNGATTNVTPLVSVATVNAAITGLPNEIQLGEVSLLLDAVLSGDEKWSGISRAGTAGAALVVGTPCYKASSGKWLPNDGILDGTDVGFKAKLGICILAAAGDTDPTKMLLSGVIRSAVFPVFTPGAAVYLGDPAGTLVVAQPSTSNFAIRIVGFASTAEDLMFDPEHSYIVVE